MRIGAEDRRFEVGVERRGVEVGAEGRRCVNFSFLCRFCGICRMSHPQKSPEFSNGPKVLINPDILRVLILDGFFIGSMHVLEY